MIRTTALAMTALVMFVASAQASTVLRAGAESDALASVETPTRVFQVPARHNRVAVTLTGQAVVRPYTYDDNYDKVFGPDEAVPATHTSGSVSLMCITKGQPWWRSADTRRTLGSGVTLVTLPLRNAWRCRVRASAMAYGVDMSRSASTVSMSVSLVAVTAR